MPDKAFNKELVNISINCLHQKDKTCSWKGLLKDYQVYKSNFFHNIYIFFF
jgi:hypothetical protein